MYRYPEFPDHVYVELTNICNARCTICATPAMKRKREIMSLNLFRKIVDECGRHGAKKLLPFLHGESLLVPGILDYFRYIRGAAPYTHINLTTNGSRLDHDVTEGLLQEDLLDSLIVSIDGGDKETFEKIRLGLRYEEVHANIIHFIRRRNTLGKSRPRVSIAMVTVHDNKHSRDRLREVWKEADEVRLSVYFNWAGKLNGEKRSRHKINFCERLYHYITILADGRVAMCCFDSEAEYAVGDLNSQTIHEVWHSKLLREKRRALYERDFVKMKLCAGCDYLNHPAWAGPLVRLRPYVRESFPQLTSAAENLYKRWLMR
ncbi:MAG: SPASM domain-containing protein [Acidobacteria bacterium]|nr:SPASM domain-containing protein [Acidobacteriota bacterium]